MAEETRMRQLLAYVKTATIEAKTLDLCRQAKIAGIPPKQFGQFLMEKYPEVWDHVVKTRGKFASSDAKTASTANLLRYALKLRSKNLPVPREVINPLAHKTQESLTILDKSLGKSQVGKGTLRQFNTNRQAEEELYRQMLAARNSAQAIVRADPVASAERARQIHRFAPTRHTLKDLPKIPPPKQPNWWQRLTNIEVPDPKYDDILTESLKGQNILRGWHSNLKPLSTQPTGQTTIQMPARHKPTAHADETQV